MLASLFHRLFHRSSPSVPAKDNTYGDTATPAPIDTDKSVHQPPLQQGQPPVGTSSIEYIWDSVICREAVLDRQQKIAGYQFLLQKAANARIRIQNWRVFHLYAEVLVRNLIHTNIFPLLGQRSVFIEIPDSFLCDPCLTQLPAANTFFILKSVDESNKPAQGDLLTWARTLRKLGYRIGIPDPIATPEYFHLLPEIDLVSMQASQIDIDKGERLVNFFLKKVPHASILVQNLSSIEDFNFCHEIGATLFQGHFVVSREQWKKADLGPSFAHLAMLLKKLQQDAETREIVSILKQDAAITLRLLRYINSAANGLQEHVSSIEHAITLLGRAPLRRWLTLLFCGSNRNQPRAAAVLETALVRARFMELVSGSRTAHEREAIFLTGLLSLIDVILQQPIEHALDVLSIDDNIRNAILRSQGIYATTLALARACESMDTSRIASAAEACHIHPEQVSACYMDALSWTLTLQQENPN
ncbi:MAG: HDOD domain-containing protein [Betaproteobacteria bacterium]|nr:HDOD domain-containing protein [Betaproteobacteria bacterium]